MRYPLYLVIFSTVLTVFPVHARPGPLPLEKRVTRLERMLSTARQRVAGNITMKMGGNQPGSPPAGVLVLAGDMINLVFGARVRCGIDEGWTELYRVTQPPGSALVCTPIHFSDLKVGDLVWVDFLPPMPTKEPSIKAFRLEVYERGGPGGGMQ